MIRRSRALALLLALALLPGAWGCSRGQAPQGAAPGTGAGAAAVAEADRGAAEAGAPGSVRPAPVHSRPFFIREQFYAGERLFAPAEDAACTPSICLDPEPALCESPALAGGIVPHHLIAGELLSGFFRDLARDPPGLVVLVGPNHENRGARMATSHWGWVTPFGTVAADQAAVDGLIAAGLGVVADPGALDPEHSVGGLMPYIKHHLPAALVLPLILHGDISLAETERLAAHLVPLLEQGAVLVGSVDFSHYLTSAEAEARDAVTWRAITRYDLPALMRMNSEYLDSPATLALVMTALRRAGAAGPDLAAHTNSGRMLGSLHAETTSYMVLKYRQPPPASCPAGNGA